MAGKVMLCKSGNAPLMTESCRLIIAFFPIERQHSLIHSARSLLADHPLRIERIEETDHGVLVFAQSTRCESMNLTAMRKSLYAAASHAGFKVRLQREDLFKAMHSLAML